MDDVMVAAMIMGLLAGGFAATLYGMPALGIPLMLLGIAVPLSMHFARPRDLAS